MAELGQPTGTIVSRSESRQIKAGSGIIEVVPAWRFLLALPDTNE